MTGETVAPDPRRLTGIPFPYERAPEAVHAWVTRVLGAPVVEVRPRSGGMSPAVAASLRTSDGRTAFVKAVGPEINPDTPTHFRHEVAVLRGLPRAPYRAELLDTFDDGDWVGLLLEDIEGEHPDWSAPADVAAVLATVQAQTAELTPPPLGVPDLSNSIALSKYVEAMVGATDAERAGLPAWAEKLLRELTSMTEATLAHQVDEALCHWDIRYDNILIRSSDRQPVLLDWGMARLGQRWADTFVFALEWAEQPRFDDIVSTAGLTPQEQDDVTGFLAGIGCYLSIQATRPPPQGLPNINAFRRYVASRCLMGVRRRMGLR